MNIYDKNREAVDTDNKYVIECANDGRILVFTDMGNLHMLKCADIPMKKLKDKGVPIDNISKYQASEEEIIYIAAKTGLNDMNLLFLTKIFKPFDSTVCRDTFGGRIVDVEKHFTVVTIEQTGRLDRTHVVIGVDAADVSILPLDRYDRDMQVGKFHRRNRMA